jgi:DNA-binding NarL/FixJ family response regulator
MADRAHAVGGVVELDSMPGWGTSLRVRFPYSRPHVDGQGAAVRVLVVDPYPVIRAGVARLLAESAFDIEVVGEAATSEEAVRLHQAAQPDVVIVSLRLGDEDVDGVELTRLLADTGPACVICLSEPGDDALVVAALREGAHGCLDRAVSSQALAHAVVAAGRGGAFLSEPALQGLHRGLRDDVADALTNREREVRALIETGLTDRLIAQRLEISVKTVEKHVSSLLRKSGARNRTQLVALVRAR